MIRLENRPEIGRAWVADQTYGVGETVLEEEAPAFWAPAGPPCGKNASKTPQYARLEKLVAVFARVYYEQPERRSEPQDPAALELLVPALDAFLRANESEREHVLTHFAVPDDATAAGHPTAKMVSALCDRVAQHVTSSPDAATLRQFVLALLTNAHAIVVQEPGHEGHGHARVALYNQLSRFAHSCAANCALDVDVARSGTGKMRVVALRAISAGDVLTLNYLFADDDMRSVFPTPVRRNYLYLRKFFACNCERCVSEDPLRTLPCSECDSLACLRPTPEALATAPADGAWSDPPETWRCLKCAGTHGPGQEILAEERAIASAVQQLGLVVDRARSAAELDMALDRMGALRPRIAEVLGRAHWAFQWLQPFAAIRLSYTGKTQNRPRDLERASSAIAGFLAFAAECVGPHAPHVVLRWAMSNLKYLHTPADVLRVSALLRQLRPYAIPALGNPAATQDAIDLFSKRVASTVGS